jgi:hypothetical protein
VAALVGVTPQQREVGLTKVFIFSFQVSAFSCQPGSSGNFAQEPALTLPDALRGGLDGRLNTENLNRGRQLTRNGIIS